MSITQKPLLTEKADITSWRKVNLSWQQIGLVGTLSLAALLNLYRLDPAYFTNEYYAAAVRSMLANWHNFFFNAYDPGGFITLDKPPVALWFQTISAWLFGYNGISILLPSVFAGVASVALLYHMVKRVFGPTAGLLAAFALAITPISVIMNRHNNPESLLILALLIAAWAVCRAAEKGHLGWLLFGIGMIGVGFNIKMLQAFIVLPAFYLLYVLLARLPWWKRLVHLSLATLVLVVVSFSWAVAVDLTPADQRPYVGGSATNSVFNLIIDYNGLNRIDGDNFGGGNRPAGQPGIGTGNNQPPAGVQFPADGAGRPGNTTGNGGAGFPGGGGIGNSVVAGQPGPLRMFDPQLAGEAGWLLPLALLGLALAALQSWRSFPPGNERRQRQQALILWGGWLLTFMVVFSMAKGIFHSYYLVMLAPAIAALFGISIEALWRVYRQGGWQSWLLPLGLVGTAVFQLNILRGYSDWNRPLALVVIGLVLVTACALLALPRLVRWENSSWAKAVTGIGLLGLLIAPLAWSVNALFNKTYSNATLPTAEPTSGLPTNSLGNGSGNSLLTALQTNWNSWFSALLIGLVVLIALALALRFFRQQLQGRQRFEQLLTVATVAVIFSLGLSLALTALPPVSAAASGSTGPASVGIIGNPSMTLSNNDKLIAFLEANRSGRTYLLATASSQNASPIIIKTGQPVMALGGFMGSDKAVTTQQLAELVQNNTVRYFLLDGGGFGRGMGGSGQTTSWVQQTCKVVDSSLWSSTSQTSGVGSNQTSPNNIAGPGRGFAGNSGGQLYDCAPQN